MNSISYYVLSALAVLIVLTVHEYAHGYVAYKLGDNTAKSLGRLSLNPIKHLDPVGAVCLVLFHFGWAKPVPINPRNFKNPRNGFALVALAGPLSNLLMAFISAFLYLLLETIFTGVVFTSKFLYLFVSNLILFVYIFHIINIGLGLFNLLPVPPLDGSRILNVILPPRIYFGIMRYERYIYLSLLAWLLIGPYLSAILLSIPLIAYNSVLSFLAKMLSLSGILSTVLEFVSGAMLKFWSLFPFIN